MPNRSRAASTAVALLASAALAAAASAAPDAGTIATPAGGARLGWVNPARCVSPCAADPGDESLARVDERGAPSKRGKLRVHRDALPSLTRLLSAAREAGHKIRINSAFRPYREQARVFRAMKERGRAARPGHSEHQLGTAIDLKLPTTAAIDWLGEHAYEYGFALSYPPGKQRVTGYRPEPWHIRFVGDEIAAEVHRRGGTLEELFHARPELGESGRCQDCPAAISRKACGKITEAGACEGTVLTWCYDGALAAVDCAVSEQPCVAAAAGASADCGPPQPKSDAVTRE